MGADMDVPLFTKNTSSNDLIIYWGNFYMGADMDVTFVY